MSESEMGVKIQNAFHSVGREASLHGFPGLEFKAQSFNMETSMDCWKACNEIDDLLNTGWRMGERFICPPFVMIIFNRAKETKENERE